MSLRRSPPAHWVRLVLSVVFAGAVAFMLPATVLAAEVRSGGDVTVGPDEVINDDVYAFGTNVVVQGTVHGDVIAAGSTVTMSGHVTGNVMAAGSTLLINGPVDGSVRLAGNLLTVSTPVAGDVLIAGTTMVVGTGARVGRDVLVAGNNMDLQAPVTRNVRAAGTRLTVGSAVGGAVDANVTDLTLGSAAVIQGPVSYVSSHDAAVAPGARIQGSIERTPPAVRAANPWEIGGIDTLAVVRGFIGMAALGMLFVLAFPRAAMATTTTVQNRWPASLGVGFAVLVATPVLALLVFGIGLIVGGWWIGLMVLGLYAMLTVVGYMTVAEWLGLEALRRTTVSAHPVWAMLLGLAILGIFTFIPVVGALVSLVATVLGIGVLVLSGWQAYRASNRTQVAPVANQAPRPLQAAA